MESFSTVYGLKHFLFKDKDKGDDSLLVPILLGVLIPMILGGVIGAIFYYLKFYKKSIKVGASTSESEKNQVPLNQVQVTKSHEKANADSRQLTNVDV